MEEDGGGAYLSAGSGPGCYGGCGCRFPRPRASCTRLFDLLPPVGGIPGGEGGGRPRLARARVFVALSLCPRLIMEPAAPSPGCRFETAPEPRRPATPQLAAARPLC
eukprot:364387-Chlamydomonas_euryale.AAC.3